MNKMQPKLRFPEFSGDLESKMLGEISDIVRGASPRPIQDPKWFDDKSDIGWLRISDATKQNGRIHFLSQRISKLGQAKTRVLLTPHLLLSIAATVGKPVINYVQTGVHDGFLIFLSPKFNIEFMFHWLNFFQSKWQQCGQPGSQVNLNSDLVKMTNVFLPTLQEQQKIGAFFKDLDDLIAISQKDLDQTKDLKSSLLQKMFPKKGAKVPEVRFPEFSGDWEITQLNHVANIFDGTHQTPNYTKSGIKFVSVENIKTLETNKFISEKDYQKEYSNKKAEKGDILMTRIGDIGTVKIIKTDESIAYYVSLALLKPINIDPDFLVCSIESSEFQKNIWNKTLHIAFPKKINLGEIYKLELTKPKTLQEQQKIGDFFKTLDELIEAKSKKLTHLKQQKQALLQQLFI